MFSMVLMAALTTGSDVPDRGRRGGGGGCCGCSGGGYGMGYGGCMGMGYGGCMGMGYGGCGGSGMGSGGMRSGMGYGGGYGGRGYGMGWGGYGMGYGGYALNNAWPVYGGTYAYAPIISNWSTPIVSNWGTPIAGGYGNMLTPGTTQSFYYNGNAGNQANQANEATIIVHLPEAANLTIDGQATQSRSNRRVFQSPPLEAGKTYTYTLRAELNRDGHFVQEKKTVDVRAGQASEVTFNFGTTNRDSDRINTPEGRGNAIPNEENGNAVPPARPQRTRLIDSTPAPRSFPTPPPRDE
jgi:uncharacterized protein (TIGR03000 family)